MKEWDKTTTIGRLKINTEHCKPERLWGRFGGGWNWMFGFRIGGSTIILHFLFFDVRISIAKKEKDNG